jgi:hypothetical protein
MTLTSFSLNCLFWIEQRFILETRNGGQKAPAGPERSGGVDGQ